MTGAGANAVAVLSASANRMRCIVAALVASLFAGSCAVKLGAIYSLQMPFFVVVAAAIAKAQ